jgi:membrane protease YdiL (CAAX protease family)
MTAPLEQPIGAPIRAGQTERVADDRAVLPVRAAGLGIAGLILGGAAGLGLALAIHAAVPGQRALILLVAQGLLWTGMLGACVLASRRYGTGSLRRDFGLRIRPVDAGWGLLLAVAARLLAGLLIVALAAASPRLTGSNLAGVTRLRHDPLALTVYCLLGVLGAPLIEELFFRGLLLRALVGRLTVWGAVPAQAVLFCLAHITPTLGLGNVSVLGATLLFGVLAGALAHRLRRLGPTMVGHAAFNLVAVLGVLVATS